MTASAMPADRFWQIIGRAARHDSDPDAHVQALRAVLRELSAEEVISFEVAFRRYLNEAYRWDLWGAAYPEAGMGGPGPPGDPFEEDEEHLAERYAKLWRRFGAAPLV